MTDDKLDPRGRVQNYKESGSPTPPSQPRKPKSEEEWRDAVNKAIEDAMSQGDFDNLRGKGKPLNLDRDPYVPEGYGLAYDLLKNNDMAPGWIGDRGELLRDIERWRSRLRETVARFAKDLEGADAATAERVRSRWLVQRRVLQDEVDGLNKRVVDVNLAQPIVSLEIFKLRLDEELRRAGLADYLVRPPSD
jgi:DnaJ family protein C protein 28